VGVDGGFEPICQVLQIGPSSHYSAKARPPSARVVRGAELVPILFALWIKNYSVYGRRAARARRGQAGCVAFPSMHDNSQPRTARRIGARAVELLIAADWR
jgi:hypothetical protein